MVPRVAALALLLSAPALALAEAPDTLKKLRATRVVTIAYRTDARPFSFEEGGQPAGYTVEVCKRVVASINQQLKGEPLKVKWVAATSQDRLELVKKGQVDMECGSTTATLSRMEQVDFSSPVFVDTTALLVRKAAGASSLGGLAGRKIAVVGETTNQRAIEAALKVALVSATVVTVKNREEGVAALEAGTVDAMAGDRVLLAGLGPKLKDVGAYELLGDDLSYEPYAIVLPRGDAGLRLAVNRALSQLYRSGAIIEVFRATFGPNVKPSSGLVVMYALNAFPE